MPDSSAERTEQATPKRKEDARKKGNVAKSFEVNSAVVLLVGTLVLSFTANYYYSSLGGMMRDVFTHFNDYQLTTDSVRLYTLQGFVFILKLLGPLVLSVLVVGAGANVLQVGFMMSGEVIKPDLKKIDPLSGFKRLFSMKSVVELIKGVIKITIVGFVIYFTIKSAAKDFILLMDQSVTQIMIFLGHTLLKVAIRASVALIVLAALDYAFQRWEYEKDLRMTKQEIREEFKEHEGDPLIKSRIRSIQREVARKRMISEVPKADVIITNPVHYAVALKYISGEMNAPQVIAKGARKIAEKIKEIAAENDIPIVEDPPLARALYKMCNIGMEVPMDLYKSVAEILAYVYRLKQKVMN